MADGIYAGSLPTSSSPIELLANESTGIDGKKRTVRVGIDVISNLAAAKSTRVVVGTLSILNGMLGYPAYTGAEVWDDGDNNGIYQKVGSTGTGSWTKLSDLLGSEPSMQLQELEDDVADIYTDFGLLNASISYNRPGDQPFAYTIVSLPSYLANSLSTLSKVPDSNVFAGGLYGLEVRVTGSTTVGTRRRHEIIPGRLYRARWGAVRRSDPSDPSGDIVEYDIIWLSASLGYISTVVCSAVDFKPTVADGQQILEKVIATSAGAGVDVVAPTNAVYAALAIRNYNDGTTGINILGIEDITAAVALDSVSSGALADIAALESLNIGSRLGALEAEIGTPTAYTFSTKAAATAATIPSTVDTVFLLGSAAVNDGLGGQYGKIVGALGGGEDGFTSGGVSYRRVENNEPVTFVDTLQDLRDLPAGQGTKGVIVLGHTTKGKGGGAFYPLPSDSSTDDDGIIVNRVSYTGRWKRLIEDGRITMEMFGGIDDRTTDNKDAFLAAIGACDEMHMPLAIIGDGYYLSGHDYQLPDQLTILGNFRPGGFNFYNPGAGAQTHLGIIPGSLILADTAHMLSGDGTTWDGVYFISKAVHDLMPIAYGDNTKAAAIIAAYTGIPVWTKGKRGFSFKNGMVVGFSSGIVFDTQDCARTIIADSNFDNINNVRMEWGADTMELRNLHAWNFTTGPGGIDADYCVRNGESYYIGRHTDIPHLIGCDVFGWKYGFRLFGVNSAKLIGCSADYDSRLSGADSWSYPFWFEDYIDGMDSANDYYTHFVEMQGCTASVCEWAVYMKLNDTTGAPTWDWVDIDGLHVLGCHQANIVVEGATNLNMRGVKFTAGTYAVEQTGTGKIYMSQCHNLGAAADFDVVDESHLHSAQGTWLTHATDF